MVASSNWPRNELMQLYTILMNLNILQLNKKLCFWFGATMIYHGIIYCYSDLL